MKASDHARAPRVRRLWLGRGLYAPRVQPGWADERDRALEAAPELVVFDAALHRGEPRFEWQERALNDGSRWQVYERFFAGESLLDELGGGRALFEGRWFVLVASP